MGDDIDAIAAVIVPRARDLGGFEVRRALPLAQRQMVGPFIFFDQMGPAGFLTGKGVDVRPHPHIGLATVTYLMHGRIHHRDSLGTDVPIAPGERIGVRAGGQGARVMVLGGATIDGPRHIWWNFVASSKERIEAAKETWRTVDRHEDPEGDGFSFIGTGFTCGGLFPTAARWIGSRC